MTSTAETDGAPRDRRRHPLPGPRGRRRTRDRRCCCCTACRRPPRVWRDVQPALADWSSRPRCRPARARRICLRRARSTCRRSTAQVVALLETELPGQPVDVVGHDWGGIVAHAPGRSRARTWCAGSAIANAPHGSVNPLRAAHVPVFALPVVPGAAVPARWRARRRASCSPPRWRSTTRLDPDVRAEYVAAYTEPDKVTRDARLLPRGRPASGGRPGSARRPSPHLRRRSRQTASWCSGAPRDPVLPVGVGEHVVAAIGSQCVMVDDPGCRSLRDRGGSETVIAVLRRLPGRPG